jgi:hypothetical protein
MPGNYPQARLALLSNPMASDKNRLLLQCCLTAVQQQANAAYPASKPVAMYFFQPMKARGCTGHPNVEHHAILAEELEPLF